MLLKKIAGWGERFLFPDETAKKQYGLFRPLLREDRRCIRSITRLEEIAHRPVLMNWTRIVLLARNLSSSAERLVDCLEKMRPTACPQIRLVALLPQKNGNRRCHAVDRARRDDVETVPPQHVAAEGAGIGRLFFIFSFAKSKFLSC